MHSLLQNSLLEQLKEVDNILIAGAGGGFDVYSSLISCAEKNGQKGALYLLR